VPESKAGRRVIADSTAKVRRKSKGPVDPCSAEGPYKDSTPKGECGAGLHSLSPQSGYRVREPCIATGPLPRDRTQSHRLHEPSYRTSTTDPMTASDISDVSSHPSVVDGDLTIYFETEATRKAYLEFPTDHPNLRLPYPASDEDDRSG
jgi:hypothetical protein